MNCSHAKTICAQKNQQNICSKATLPQSAEVFAHYNTNDICLWNPSRYWHCFAFITSPKVAQNQREKSFVFYQDRHATHTFVVINSTLAKSFFTTGRHRYMMVTKNSQYFTCQQHRSKHEKICEIASGNDVEERKPISWRSFFAL